MPGLIFFVLWFCPKKGVGDARVVEAAYVEEVLHVLIHLPHAVVSKAGLPGVVVCSHSNINIAKNEQLFFVGHVADLSSKFYLYSAFNNRHCCKSAVQNLQKPLNRGIMQLCRLFLMAKPTQCSLFSQPLVPILYAMPWSNHGSSPVLMSSWWPDARAASPEHWPGRCLWEINCCPGNSFPPSPHRWQNSKERQCQYAWCQWRCCSCLNGFSTTSDCLWDKESMCIFIGIHNS